MKEKIEVKVERVQDILLTNISFAKVSRFSPFYAQRDLKLNLMKKPRPTGIKQPLMIWYCGGGFQGMDKDFWTPWLNNFCKLGFIVATPEYRTGEQATFPNPIEDAKKAIRYLRSHADEYDIDPNRIVIGGESAGAYVSIMAGVTGGKDVYNPEEYEGVDTSVSAVIEFYGPIRLEMLKQVDPKAQGDALQFIDEKTPPFFIVHGSEDPIVPVSHSHELHDALEKNHVPVTFYEIEGAKHMTPEFYQDEVFEKIKQFLQEQDIL